MNQQNTINKISVSWWQPVLFAAMAGGMAWGIRGQYGHETGAMIAGLLVSFTLIFLLCPKTSLLHAARAVALCTVAMGFGGSMTYGSTVGLTHDAPLVGHWGALGWGLLGLSIKGSLWIAFAGAFLGMGLSNVRYRPMHYLCLMLWLVAMYFLGVYLINFPFEPEQRQLPWLYFSDHWYWEPDENVKPRFECWGGLLLGVLSLFIYTTWLRKDVLASRMILFGLLGGAIGFPLGQSLQAWHAWNPELFSQGWLAEIDPYINWWNMMETTFGAVMGAMLGLGLWLNRSLISPQPNPDPVTLPGELEALLLAIHLPFLILVEFMAIPEVDMLYDIGIIMGVIPIVAIIGGRWWPFLTIFPVILIPIAGKTTRELVFEAATISPPLGLTVYLLVPLLIVMALAIWFGRQAGSKIRAGKFLTIGLLVNTWFYFLLNWAFFRFPWPWEEWTRRTPNGIIFTICAIGLTIMVLIHLRRVNSDNS